MNTDPAPANMLRRIAPRDTAAYQHGLPVMSDPALDRIAALAARLLAVPMVMIGIVDDRHASIAAHHGCLPDRLTPMADLCAWTWLGETPYVVRNMLHERRMANHPLVATGDGLRFCACVPLRLPETGAYGALCLFDHRARAMSGRGMDILQTLAATAADLIGRQHARARQQAAAAGGRDDDAQGQHLQKRLLRSQAASRRVAMTLQSVREEERKRIARELHDDLGQLLAAMRIDLSGLQQHAECDADTLHATLAKMDGLLVSSIDSLRRIAADLRPKALDEGGLYFALQSLLENFLARHGIRYRFHACEADLALDDAYAAAVFRIVQESLTNISRHACATQVEITMARDAHQLTIQIRDDGRGIRRRDLTKQNSFGLLGMRERVKEMGGHIAVSGLHRQGTHIAIALPLPEA